MRRDAGSVFVESMIAATIVAVALGGTFQVIGDGAARDRASQDRRLALLVAQSELAAVGAEIPLVSGQNSGLADDMTWRVDITPYGDGVDASAVGPLWRVSVTVRRRDGGPDLARLETLKLDTERRGRPA